MVWVAPLVGAWIEIYDFPLIISDFGSLPLWERGLKCWVTVRALKEWVSLPLWERGLKFAAVEIVDWSFVSLPLWERGLK